MTANTGTLVTGPVRTQDTNDTYPTHEALNGKGGLRSVLNTTARDAISSDRREAGMEVVTTVDFKKFRLGNDLSTWTDVTDATLSVLASTAGAGLVGTAQGITVQQSLDNIRGSLIRQTITATGGQTVFSLTGGITYTIGGNNLAVYLNGQRVFSPDYTETSTNSITFTSGAVAGDIITLEVHSILSVVTGTASGVTFVPYSGITATDVQGAIHQAEDQINLKPTNVTNVAALRAATSSTLTANSINLLGYYTVLGGGGGPLNYDSADSTTPDDGATVFVDSSSRRWKRTSNQSVSTLQAGCVIDGVTDDSARLKAFASLITSGAIKQAIISPGVHFMNTNGNTFDVNGANGFSIIGTFGKSQILTGTSANARSVTIRNCSNFEVSGITFKVTQSGAVSSDCCDMMNISQAKIHNNIFDSGTFYGLGIFEDTISNTATACDDLEIFNNYFTNIGCIGMEPFPKVLSKNIKVYANTFNHCGFNPNSYSSSLVAMKVGGGYQNAEAFDNQFYDNVAGIFSATYNSVHLHDNQFLNTQSYGIAVTAAQHPGSGLQNYISATHNLCVVEDNFFAFTPSFVPTAATPSMEANGSVQNNGPIIFRNNTIRLAGGISVQPSIALPMVQVVGNKLIDPLVGVTAILAADTFGTAPFGIVITDNEITNTDLTRASLVISLINSPMGQVLRNKITKSASQCILLQNCPGTLIEGNEFIEPNILNASSVGMVNVQDATSCSGATNAANVAPGSGYVVGDLITLTGGTAVAQPVLKVMTLSGSGVATVEVIIPGAYSSAPSNPVAQGSSTGSGTGATFNLTLVTQPYQIYENRVIQGLNGNPKALLNGTSATPTIYMDGNWSDTTVPNAVNGTPTISAPPGVMRQRGQQRTVIGSAAPTGGTFLQGDACVNLTPSIGLPQEWVCTAGGTPGTWKVSGWCASARGVTGSRPTKTTMGVANDVDWSGTIYFDTTLVAAGKPIWWTGITWVDSTGAAV